MRITVNGKRAELSTSRAIDPNRWDSKANKVKGYKPDAKSINRHLDQMKQHVFNAQHELTVEGKEITVKCLKDRITGSDKDQKSIKEIFKMHNEKMHSLIGKDYSISTHKKYQNTFSHLMEFMETEYGDTDLSVGRVDIKLLNKFEYYLKTEANCSHNTVMRYMSHLKKITNIAIQEDLLNKDPFDEFNHKYKKKEPVFLTQDELDRIEQKEFDIDRLDRVRDVFVFSCYTGLSFSDAEKLSKSEIKTDNEGDLYLHLPRTKTGEVAQFMLLPNALKIIEKYSDDPETEDGNLLPMISNQKTNAYLKEIADVCGVKKNLTHHVARHTCATTVLLPNGVPIETVQKILGHANLSSTMIYARVTQSAVNKAMKAVRENLAKTG